MPSLQLLFGPLLIGSYLNTILYGILLVQSFIYYRTYRKDPPAMRYFILFLVLCDTLNTVFDIGVIYEPLVFRYGTPRAVEHVPIMLYVDPLMTVIISTSVQTFICWRIKVITKSLIIPCFIGAFVFCSLVGGVATCISSTIFVNFSQLENFKGAVITWLTSSAIVDVSITISLVVSLAKRRTGNSRTDDAIDRIIRLTIHTGAVTALFAILDLVLFVAVPNTSLNFAFDFPLAKLYTNSLLSTLNARGGWYNTTSQQRPQHNVLFGPSSWNSDGNTSNSSSTRKTDQYSHAKNVVVNSDTLVLSDVSGSSEASGSTLSPNLKRPERKQAYNIDLESAMDSIIDGDTTLKTSGSIPTFNVPATL